MVRVAEGFALLGTVVEGLILGFTTTDNGTAAVEGLVVGFVDGTDEDGFEM